MKWISVKDSLPPIGEFVMLFDGDQYQVGQRREGTKESRKLEKPDSQWWKDYYYNFCTSCCYSFSEPTHWASFVECS